MNASDFSQIDKFCFRHVYKLCLSNYPKKPIFPQGY